MKITRDNYETYFLDYAEGRMEEELTDQLFVFLQQNPDLKEELSLFEMIELPLENMFLPDKERLYRTDLTERERFDNKAVAWLEGDMSPEEAMDFEREAKKMPEKKAALELFERTKLTADLTLVFQGRNKLYRQPRIGVVPRWWLSAAAVFLTALAIWGLWPHSLQEVVHAPMVVEAITEAENILTPSEETMQADPAPAAPVRAMQTESITGMPHDVNPVTREDIRIPERNSPSVSEHAINEPLPVIYASLENPVPMPVLETTMPHNYSNITGENDAYTPLSERVVKELGAEDLSIRKLISSGLKFAGTLTNKKFSADINPAGEIVALSLDTRILGFHIPIGKKD